MNLKLARELYVMALKNDPSFEEVLTRQFKIHIRNLTNLDMRTQKSRKFARSWASFKYIMFELKEV